jgi:mannosyltransferase OCH1-like enzyme
MKRIAIFNSFPYHYEVFATIIEWCKNEGHYLMILTDFKNNYGWFDFYKTHFGFDNFKNWKKYKSYLHLFDLIILTTDDDKNFEDIRYDNISRTVIINHTNYYRRSERYQSINFRPYTSKNYNNWCFNTFKYDAIHTPSDKIKIFVSAMDEGLNVNILKDLSETCELHFVARNCREWFKSIPNSYYHLGIDIYEMIKLMESCDYFYYIHDNDSRKNLELGSGFTGLAFACGTPFLTIPKTNTFYGFESACYYTTIEELSTNLEIKRERVLRERDLMIANFKKNFDAFVPESTLVYANQIPKKIHFLWLSKDEEKLGIPEKYLFNVKTYIEKNPDFEIILWDNQSIKILLETKYPQYIELINSLTRVISKCDFIRFLIIYSEGGVYSDLDFYCRENLCEIIKDKKEVFYEEIPEHEPKHRHISNGFFCSVPKTEFIKGWIDRMVNNFNRDLKINSSYFVWNTTSPKEFWKYYMSLSNPPRLSDTCESLPYTNNQEISKLCKYYPTKQVVYTLWNEGSGWGSGGCLLNNLVKVSRNLEDIDINELIVQNEKNLNSSVNTFTPFSIVVSIIAGILFLILLAILAN